MALILAELKQNLCEKIITVQEHDSIYIFKNPSKGINRLLMNVCLEKNLLFSFLMFSSFIQRDVSKNTPFSLSTLSHLNLTVKMSSCFELIRSCRRNITTAVINFVIMKILMTVIINVLF